MVPHRGYTGTDEWIAGKVHVGQFGIPRLVTAVQPPRTHCVSANSPAITKRGTEYAHENTSAQTSHWFTAILASAFGRSRSHTGGASRLWPVRSDGARRVPHGASAAPGVDDHIDHHRWPDRPWH